MQVAVVRYLVGGPSVMNAEDLARQDAEMATKTDGTVLSPDLVRKAHEMLVDVIRESGCSKVPCFWAWLPEATGRPPFWLLS